MRALKVTLVLALCSCAMPALAIYTGPQAELMQSARLWELRHRDDLAQAALEKILLVEPRQPEVLLMLGLLKMRINEMEAANRLVQRLQQAQPGSVAARQLADAYRVATRDRLKMATVRRLMQSNQSEQAIKELRALFPNGPPPAQLGLEYYGLIGDSAEGWEEARKGLAGLVQEFPEDPRYRLALASLLQQREATRPEALRMLSALSRDPDADHEQVTNTQKRALARQPAQADTISQLRELIAQSPKDPELLRQLNDARAVMLKKEGDVALSSNQPGLALRKLEEAVTLAPSDPWTRFALAKLYVRLGLPDQARDLMSDGIARSPKDGAMLYAQALLSASMDDEDAALSSLAKIPASERSASMRVLEARVRVASWRKQAVRLAAEGDTAAVQRVLESAAERAGKDPQLLSGVALSWIEAGQIARGLALMRQRLGEPATLTGAPLLAWAEVLNRIPDDVQLAPLLPRLLADAAIMEEDAETVSRLETSALLRHAEGLRAAGKTDEAFELLTQALQTRPDDLRLLDARADFFLARGQNPEALALYRKLIERAPDDLDLQLSYAKALRLSGERQAARNIIDEVLSHAAADDISTRLSVVRQRLSLDDIEGARLVVQDLLKLAPKNPAVLVQAGRVERADRNYELALDYFHRAHKLEPRIADSQEGVPRLLSAAEEEIMRLEQRRDGFITVGLNLRDKPGSAGVSEFYEREIPVELVVPVGYDAHFFAHLDTVQLSAGRLPAVYDDAALYGKVQAFGPAALALFPNGREQKADGIDVGVGYETDHWRFDLGSTPIGFPVTDVVGGIKYSGSFGETDYSADFSRRPITSSLLSYSGAHDPVTGEIWGGVRSLGLDTRIARDFGRLGTSFSAGFHQLTGRNVASNNFLSLRAAADWHFINHENTKLDAGLALTHWRYSKNLSGYTFGHGGYYSPQTYTSLALPVDWMGRLGRWSYRLRGSVSYSQSQENDTPFYPTAPALQTAALASPFPAGYSSPVLKGGPGSGIGYSLKGALEYQLLPDYFIGSAYELDRSAYYSPNLLTLYVRHVLQDWLNPVPYPPRPPKSYADL